uniref:Proline-rich receptor-like protein kinase PERK2 n=1 Tax=Elaeis guineensis var. tenera TaxID=51953 RepID=A0A6I9QJ78_ELAGV|nr:proline-rich receptor-like protein kinase PERK2 [Elaeis guineensis]
MLGVSGDKEKPWPPPHHLLALRPHLHLPRPLLPPPSPPLLFPRNPNPNPSLKPCPPSLPSSLGPSPPRHWPTLARPTLAMASPVGSTSSAPLPPPTAGGGLDASTTRPLASSICNGGQGKDGPGEDLDDRLSRSESGT